MEQSCADPGNEHTKLRPGSVETNSNVIKPACAPYSIAYTKISAAKDPNPSRGSTLGPGGLGLSSSANMLLYQRASACCAWQDELRPDLCEQMALATALLLYKRGRVRAPPFTLQHLILGREGPDLRECQSRHFHLHPRPLRYDVLLDCNLHARNYRSGSEVCWDRQSWSRKRNPTGSWHMSNSISCRVFP